MRKPCTRTQVSTMQNSYNALVANVVNIIKSEIQAGILSVLKDSAVAAAASALPSAGTAAIPTFVTVFGTKINVEMVQRATNIVNQIRLTTNTMQLAVAAFPVLTADNLHESCGWSEWTRI